MNADHYYAIGNEHKVCQDYAISLMGENGAFCCIADGCSSSPETDMGARLLAFSAKRTAMVINGFDMSYDLFGKITIDNLRNIGDTIPLHPQSLDSTLLVAWVKDKEFKVHMYGDGVFFHKTATTLRIVHVDFESNEPSYLSYYLDKLRFKEYNDSVATGSKRIVDVSIYTATKDSEPADGIELENYVKPFEPVTFKGLATEGDLIGVISDGINSFRRGDASDIPWQGMVRDFIEFKSTVGVFVQRRLGFLKRQWTKELVSHYDDISMASIIV